MERIDVFSKCTTDGDTLLLTSGIHLNTDNGLKAADMSYRGKQADAMKSEIKVIQDFMMKVENMWKFWIKKSTLTS